MSALDATLTVQNVQLQSMTVLLVQSAIICQAQTVCLVPWMNALLALLSANALNVSQATTPKRMAAACLAHPLFQNV